MIKIYAGKIFDSYSCKLVDKRVITVSPESGLIQAVEPYSPRDLHEEDFSDPDIVDLSNQTVLPGFVDAHVHCKGFSRNLGGAT